MPDNQQTIYRFRPNTPLSLKELLYGELYLVTRDELNDPYDTKSPALFDGNTEIYIRLVSAAVSSLSKVMSPHILLSQEGLEIIGSFLSNQKMLYPEFSKMLSSKEFENVVFSAVTASNHYDVIGISLSIIKHLRFYIHKHVGTHWYIVSFSKNNSNPVMWSHYSSQHTGFCLCFTIENNELKTENLKQEGRYQLEKVNYKDSNNTVNAFYSFHGGIYGMNISKDNIKEYSEQKKASYLTKYKSWSYEEEIRILKPDALGGHTNENGIEKHSIVDRIVYYDKRQLTGIIFGSRMNESSKSEILEIILQLRSSEKRQDYLMPIFTFYQAKENPHGFRMQIVPLYGLDVFNKKFQLTELEEKKKQYEQLNEYYLRNRTDSKPKG